MPTLDTVRRFALALPEATEGTSYGTPAFKVRGKLFARLRDGGDGGGEVLVVKADFGDQEALLQLQPEVYFLTPHYVGYPCVLVRLARIEEEELRERLIAAWRYCAPKRLAASFAQP